MEIPPSDIQTLRDMVSREWFPHEERELESTFGVDGVVDSTRFLAVAQRLKSKGLTEIRQPDRLTISLEDNTRYTIQGEGTIVQYCEDNKIAGKSAVVMIKDRAGDLHTLDLKEYDTRIKIRREIPLDLNDPRVKSHYATWDQRVKFFRLIQRWTFKGNGVIFDLSMVRSTKKDDRGFWKQVKTFYDENLHHNIMKEMPSYEIEVELERGTEHTDTPEKALACLIQGIGEVLRGIQRNPILIRNSVRDKVLEEYRSLVNPTADPTRKGFRGVQPVTLERKNITPSFGSPCIQAGYNVTDKADGLRVMGFCNENGELFMLDMGLNVYRTGLKKLACKNTLVDGEWITKNKDNEAIQMLMLFDIYHGIENDYSYLLPFYNPVEEVKTRYKELQKWGAKWRGDNGPVSLVKGLTPQNSLKVMEKKFLFADGSLTNPTLTIFTKCRQMLERRVNYNTDGLILTENIAPIPDRFGVRFPKQFKWKPAHDNTIDFLVKIVKDPASNQDKLTDIIRPDSQDTIKYKTLRLYIGTSADPAYDDPRRTILMIKKLPSGRPGGRGVKKYRMRPVLFSPSDFEDSNASICYLEAKEDPATRDWVIRCTTKDDAPGEATGDPITNNSIVEMRYDPNPSIPSGWGWVPIRVRYDKTERFQSGTLDKTMNSKETADSVWNSIHEPVTLHMITTGDDRPSPEEERLSLIDQQQQSTASNRYYQKKSTIKNIQLVKNMTHFHNIIVKGQIMTEVILEKYASLIGKEASYKPIVIDTSIGKGGDLKRYYPRVGFLLGVDLDADGIRDPDEGAYRRYMDNLVLSYSRKDSHIPTMLFLIGDSTKSYADGKSGINEEESDMMRGVFGKVNPAAKVPPYIDAKCRGRLKDGADFMYSMFSIHYYFSSKETWEGYLNNIRDNLKVGGFFLCCCFDGNIVVDKLKDIEKGESIQGVDSTTGATIWKITKENSLGEVLPSTEEEGFGHAIDVDFLSIGSTHREYLVSPKLLRDQLYSIGLELVHTADAQLLGGMFASMSFEEVYNANNGESTFPMANEVKEFSFLNRYYIFRRYGMAPGAPLGAETPAYRPTSPTGNLTPAYRPTSPTGNTTPAYRPTSPTGNLTPAYRPTSPTGPSTPLGAPANGGPQTPEFGRNAPLSLPYRPSSPTYPPPPPSYAPSWTGGPGAGLAAASANARALASAVPTNWGSPAGRSAWVWGVAASTTARPASLAWASVPLSGNEAVSAALHEIAPRTPPLPPLAPGEDELPPQPEHLANLEPSDRQNAIDEWEAKKMDIEMRARNAEEARLPAGLSEDEREERLAIAAYTALGAAIQRYQQRRGTGLVTAVVEGGSSKTATSQGSSSKTATSQGGSARTVAVEKGAIAGPQKKYKPSEIFRFFGRAEVKDVLKIGDPGAARWLALSAPFPIKDGATEYPSVNHYLAAMKYKHATDKPELAPDLFSSKGTLHAKYLRLREQIASKHGQDKEKKQVKEAEDQELLRSEANDVADAALPKTIKRYKAQFDEAKWIAHKDDALKEALSQRWKHDARFRTIVEAAREQGKYLLYYTGSTTITSFGGIRRDDGHIEGENQVGKIIMELAGYPPM
jgi:predicted NAD-dependent protein-ADP-ribosyltransferase YbiA (DUF1768 family)